MLDCEASVYLSEKRFLKGRLQKALQRISYGNINRVLLSLFGTSGSWETL